MWRLHQTASRRARPLLSNIVLLSGPRTQRRLQVPSRATASDAVVARAMNCGSLPVRPPVLTSECGNEPRSARKFIANKNEELAHSLEGCALFAQGVGGALHHQLNGCGVAAMALGRAMATNAARAAAVWNGAAPVRLRGRVTSPASTTLVALLRARHRVVPSRMLGPRFGFCVCA